MALEDLTGTDKFIANLVNTNPLSADDRREGDDHIRGIKNVLLNSFPGISAPVDLAALPTYVKKSGDTMTGALTVQNAGLSVSVDTAAINAVVTLSKPPGVAEASIFFEREGVPRFRLMANADLESTGNAGSNFVLQAFNDAGALSGTPLSVNRASLEVQVPKLAGATATFSGAVSAGGTLSSAGSVLSGTGQSKGPALWVNPGDRNILAMAGDLTGIWSFTWNRNNGLFSLTGATGQELHQFDPSGGAAKSSGAGPWNAIVSDARAKRDIEDYREGLASVLALRPRSFRFVSEAGMGDAVQLGFIEQESRGILPSVPSPAADKLGIADLMTNDQTPLSYMLVNAIKELAGRVAALELLCAGVGDA